MNKKAQMDPRELVLTLVLVGALAVVSILIFSNVTNSADNIFDPDEKETASEAVTISATKPGDDNSTLLAEDGFLANTERVVNTSSGSQLTRNVDYKVTLNGVSGALDTTANFTLINTSSAAPSGFNNSALQVTYRTNERSKGQLSSDKIETTVLDSFELGVISLIVLAAVVILAVLFRLGS